jgi:tetratricopeptide (TPR) repeat protein
MGVTSSVRVVMLVVLLALLRLSQVGGQFDAMMFQEKPPQAQSRQELYAFLHLVDNSDSDQLLALTDQFIKTFSKSEFLAFVHRMRMNAYRQINEYQRAIEAAEKALELNPQDIDVLLGIANLLPQQATDQSSVVLSTAEGYAQRALKEIVALKAPRTLSLDNWEQTVGAMRASAHCALGVVALKRGRYSDSVAEFEICTRQNHAAAGPQFYMFGVALLLDRKVEQARAALQRAAELGPEVVKAQAEVQLRSLEKK